MRLLQDPRTNYLYLILDNNSCYFLVNIDDHKERIPHIKEFNSSTIVISSSQKYRIGNYYIIIYAFSKPDIDYFPEDDEINELTPIVLDLLSYHWFSVSHDQADELVTHIENVLSKDQYFFGRGFSDRCVFHLKTVPDRLKTILDLMGITLREIY